MRAFVEVAHGLDPIQWPNAHARGEVPNRLPFGVDQLSEHGIELTLRRPLRSPTGKRVARWVDARTGHLQWVEAGRDALRWDRWGVDVVLCWDEWNGVPASYLSTLPGAPPVVTGVMNLTDWSSPSPAFLRVVRGALRRAAAVWVHAPAQIDLLERNFAVPKDRMHVVTFGVDAEYFTPLTEGQNVNGDLVVSVGDDSHRDHETLIRAVARVRDRRQATRLSLATLLPVSLPTDLGNLQRKKLGPLRPAFYRSAAVVAVAARPNVHGSGLSVLLEAMASGRPYVATSSPGFAGYVESGETGLLVPPGDDVEFAAALSALLDDPERASAMGMAGRRLVEERLNTRRQAADLAAVLDSVVH